MLINLTKFFNQIINKQKKVQNNSKDIIIKLKMKEKLLKINCILLIKVHII